MELLGCGRQKAVKNLAELDSEKGIGLIEKKRLGLGRANVIYVKNFMLKETVETEEKSQESLENTQKYENQTSRSMKISLQQRFSRRRAITPRRKRGYRSAIPSLNIIFKVQGTSLFLINTENHINESHCQHFHRKSSVGSSCPRKPQRLFYGNKENNRYKYCPDKS